MAADPRPARHAALAALLGAEGLDALLVTSLANIRYLTGFSGSAGLLLAHAGDPLLVTDFRYQEQAEAEVNGAARVVVERTSAWERLFREAGGSNLGTIGYEAHALSAKDAERLGVLGKGWRWRAAPELVERLRVRKSAPEVAAIRTAAQLAAQALATTLAGVHPGQTEREIAGALEAELRRLGSENHPFPTIVASGPRTAWPHARTSGRTVARGEWLLLDFGAQVDGYCADITRTVLVGARASDVQRTVYELVRTAQRTARERIRAGMPAREADALARDLIEARGFGDAFGHSLGHGLGLEVHEAPRLARTNAEPLPVDAVVTVEPGIYLTGQGGVRLEDDVHVAANGPVLLSDGATDLLELC
ncbi:MAG TPA: aminopeptidase P family protein [Gemmatimonadales bacterium]|nr:aminopeptidase P family protein [Gemmatimonadales bacterium]